MRRRWFREEWCLPQAKAIWQTRSATRKPTLQVAGSGTEMGAPKLPRESPTRRRHAQKRRDTGQTRDTYDTYTYASVSALFAIRVLW